MGKKFLVSIWRGLGLESGSRDGDDTFKRPEQEQAVLRLVIAVLAFVYALLLVDPLEVGLVVALQRPLFNLPALFLALALVFVVVARSIHTESTGSAYRISYRLATILADLGMLSAAMYYAPAEASPFYWVYLFVVIGNGMRYGLPYLYVATLVACGSFSYGVLTLPYWETRLLDGLGRAFGLLVIPAYSGVLIRRLQDRSSQLRVAMEAKSRFIANMSHELRTPLHAVLALSETLLHRKIARDEASMLHMIKTSAQTQLELVNQILDVSKVEAGRYRMVPVALNPYTLIGEVVEIIWPQVRGKGLDLRVYVDPRLPTALRGPAPELRQVLVNLAGNAVKFTESGFIDLRLLLLSSRDGECRMQFSVIDTGVGIADADMEAIFEAFTQTDGTITRRFGGTGLGLTISRQLVQLMGGNLTVTSRVGVGSSFRFEVSLRLDTDAGLDRLTDIEPVHVVAAGFEALPAEVERTCERNGFVVDRVDSLQQAVSCLEDHPARPHTKVVLVNAHMARLFFVKIVQTLKSSFPDRRHAIIGIGADPLDKEFQDAGATALMTEFDETQFLRAVRLFASDRRAAVGPRKVENGERFKVLVVDDSRTNREVARLVLEEAGHEVCMADGGKAALELLADENFDIALLDLRMPGMSGLDVAQRFRAVETARPRMPLILLTADLASEVHEVAEAAGIDKVLTKPIEPRLLLGAIEAVRGARQPDRPGEERSGPRSLSAGADPLLLGSTPALVEGRLEALAACSLDDRRAVLRRVVELVRDMDTALAQLAEPAGPAAGDRAPRLEALANACSDLGAQRCFYLLHETAHCLRDGDTARFNELREALSRDWLLARGQLLARLGIDERVVSQG